MVQSPLLGHLPHKQGAAQPLMCICELLCTVPRTLTPSSLVQWPLPALSCPDFVLGPPLLGPERHKHSPTPCAHTSRSQLTLHSAKAGQSG